MHLMLYRAMGESNAVRVRRPLMRKATARRAAEIYAEKFGTEDGALPATYQASPVIGHHHVHSSS